MWKFDPGKRRKTGRRGIGAKRAEEIPRTRHHTASDRRPVAQGKQLEKTRADLRRIQAAASKLALAGPLTLGLVARDLGVSPRSLQRELALNDTSFRQIVDTVRFDIPRTLLTRTDFPVQAIAAKVGYRTPGSFARAFHRWTGKSPRAYRQAGSLASM